MKCLRLRKMAEDKLDCVEIFPDFGRFKDCKIVIFKSGEVYVNHEELNSRFAFDVEAAKEIAGMLRKLAEAVERHYLKVEAEMR